MNEKAFILIKREDRPGYGEIVGQVCSRLTTTIAIESNRRKVITHWIPIIEIVAHF